MIATRRWHLATLILLGFGLIACLPAKPTMAEEPRPVQIGLPQTLFKDVPKSLMEALMPTFKKLMERQMGKPGDVMLLSGADEVGRDLGDGKVQLGVFHGFEFAWAQTKNPDLRPLVIAVKQNQKLNAQVIVASNSSYEKLEDLKDQPIAIAHGTPEHARLFLSRRTQRIGHRMEKFFGPRSTPQNVVLALDDVINGKAKATVVDGAAWENYCWMNPARAAKLKPLIKSEDFPAGVIAYKQGGLTDADIKRFRDGLTTAHENSMGMQLMMLWKMKRFDVVPADYQQTLTNIAKAYPPPIGDEP
jgi:ABC-type phosphate/phosphonate transport system substrate-binding protein